MSQDEYKAWAKVAPLGDIPESSDIAADLLKLMASPAIASRRWIWEQYDSQVGADTVQTGGDAALVRVHGTRKALAMTTDCTPRYCYADPVEGGRQAVAEAFRNLCAVGARPLAITNCLNFGNPQRPEIMAQIVGCLQGMSEACVALDMPIVSGNVSLYNESKATGGGSAILPTPAIGAVGVLDDWEKSATIGFKADGHEILLIGRAGTHLPRSLWQRDVARDSGGPPPPVDLADELRAGEFVRAELRSGEWSAVHDISDGGLLVALAEMALAGNIGAELSEPLDTAAAFGEDQARYVVTAPPGYYESLIETPVALRRIGTTGGDALRFNGTALSLADLRAAHEGFFPALMGVDGALA
jgi:phosphoribosylformylglycinamidine synthase